MHTVKFSALPRILRHPKKTWKFFSSFSCLQLAYSLLDSCKFEWSLLIARSRVLSSHSTRSNCGSATATTGRKPTSSRSRAVQRRRSSRRGARPLGSCAPAGRTQSSGWACGATTDQPKSSPRWREKAPRKTKTISREDRCTNRK